jgi:hypothetical protein
MDIVEDVYVHTCICTQVQYEIHVIITVTNLPAFCIGASIYVWPFQLSQVMNRH